MKKGERRRGKERGRARGREREEEGERERERKIDGVEMDFSFLIIMLIRTNFKGFFLYLLLLSFRFVFQKFPLLFI